MRIGSSTSLWFSYCDKDLHVLNSVSDQHSVCYDGYDFSLLLSVRLATQVNTNFVQSKLTIIFRIVKF